MDQRIQRLRKGVELTVIFRDQQLRRRVWEDLETFILVCTNEEYQQALAEQRQATCSGIRKENVVEVH